MKRKCEKIPIEQYLVEMEIVNIQNVSIYIDIENEKECAEILNFLQKEKSRKKFKSILYAITQGQNNSDLYGGEDIGRGTSSIKAMKFKGSIFNNTRIYCKEFFQNGKKIVMIEMLLKKAQRNKDDKKITTRLKTIGGYEYDFK